MDDTLHKLEDAINEFKNKEKILSPEPTLFEIAGFPSRENVFSNVLAFYLDSRQKHNLSSLVLKSLVQDIVGEIDSTSLETEYLGREELTFTSKRIDLVIETRNYVVAIENKVYHVLNNDLADYSYYLDETYKRKKKQLIKIVLGFYYEKNVSNDFFFVSYASFIEKLKSLASQLSDDNIYHIYFKDFIKNIQNHITPFDMENKELEFISTYEDEIQKIFTLKKRADTYLYNRSRIVFNGLKLPSNWTKSIWGSQITSQKNIDGDSVTVLCTYEISSIYIEIGYSNNLSNKLMSYLFDYNVECIRQTAVGVLTKEFIPIWQTSDEIIQNSYEQLISLIEQFILKNYQDVQPN